MRGVTCFAVAGLLASAAMLIAGQAAARSLIDIECSSFRGFSIDGRELQRPKAPSCVEGYGPFEEYSFNSCRAEMENYQSTVENFSRCLAAEKARLIDEYNEAVEQFNSRAQ